MADQESKELLPCPHCIKSITEAVFVDVSNRWQVCCGACGSSSGSYKTEEKAVIGWNTRAQSKQLTETQQALDTAVEALWKIRAIGNQTLNRVGKNSIMEHIIGTAEAALASIKE